MYESTKNTNTNTNNTKGEQKMNVRISYALVNRIACQIYRNWVKNHPEDRNRDTYNLAMKEAWKEAKFASYKLENPEDFAKLPEEEQFAILRQKATLVPLLVMREKHIVNGEAVFHGVNRIAWMLRKKDGGKALESWNDSINMIVSEMYIAVMTKWEKYLATERSNKSFADFLLCCAKNSAFRIGRQLEDKPSRQSKNNPSLDNENFTHDLAFNSVYYYPSPEEQAIAESIMESLCKDENDKLIQHGKIYGFSQKEISNMLSVKKEEEIISKVFPKLDNKTVLMFAKIMTKYNSHCSQVAVSKRITTMKDKYHMMQTEVLTDEVNNTIFRTAEHEYSKSKASKTKRIEVEADGRYYQYEDVRYYHSIPFLPEEDK